MPSTTRPARATADAAAMHAPTSCRARIAAPRLGFFGVIDERLDLDLVARLADADPAWQIVMVGPVVKIDPAALPRRPNLHWLGQQPYALLPQLVAGWDVCLMPFALNESTEFISPTKTLEYMAAGKPVVSTPIHDVKAMFGDIVAIAASAERFIAACRPALRRVAGAAQRARRRACSERVRRAFVGRRRRDDPPRARRRPRGAAPSRSAPRRAGRAPSQATRRARPRRGRRASRGDPIDCAGRFCGLTDASAREKIPATSTRDAGGRAAAPESIRSRQESDR